MKQALIVVDVQESFRSRPYFRAEELPGFLRNVQSLINRSRARGIPVVQVLHREGGDDPRNPFTEASGQVRAMPELTLQPDLVVYKQVHSAMFGRSDTGLRSRAWPRAASREPSSPASVKRCEMPRAISDRPDALRRTRPSPSRCTRAPGWSLGGGDPRAYRRCSTALARVAIPATPGLAAAYAGAGA
jgi:hypothetical protein